MDEKRVKEIFSLFNKTKVFVIGDSILDAYIIGDAHRISPEAPIPVVLKKKEEFRVGGAANVALNLAALGAKVTLLTSANPNGAGKTLLDILDAHGVKTILGNQRHTIVKTRIVAHNQQVVRIDDEKDRATYGFFFNASEIEYISKTIDENDIILFSDYDKGVITQELLDFVVNLSKNKGKFIGLDPKPSNKLKFTGLDLITPNKKEANELLGKTNLSIDELVARLDEKYKTRILALTLSEEGLALSENGTKAILCPCINKQVVDVCGAGDVCCAVLALTLKNNANIGEAAYLANIACGIVVEKFGTATVNQQEILNRSLELEHQLF